MIVLATAWESSAITPGMFYLLFCNLVYESQFAGKLKALGEKPGDLKEFYSHLRP